MTKEEYVKGMLDDRASFARSQAIALVKWQASVDTDLFYDPHKERWINLITEVVVSDDEAYSQFLLWQEKQQEGKGEI